MIYIVFGQPRTGTSRTMRMLELGGIPCLKSAERDNPTMKMKLSNPYGLYENFKDPMIDGYAIKVLNRQKLKQLMTEFDCKVIKTYRSPEQIALSWEAVTGKARKLQMIEQRREAQLKVMKDIPHVVADYDAVARDPKAFCQSLKDFGIPIDVDKSTSGFDASLYKVR